ncbi:MAG: sigma-70 family RNA polymerase sigma factor [Armatimonadetes bacterium]|nr:sigma-70 family RNA polymerase sigma factor [Armatimonadota bacterium]
MQESGENDGELIRRIRAGERAALEILVDRYQDDIYRVAYHLLGHVEDAQDAAQEALVQAYLRLDQLRDPEKFGPWLRRVTANVCIERMRRRTPPAVPLQEIEAIHRFTPSVPGPEWKVERLAVRDALGRLSEKERIAVTLHYVSGYSHTEIARYLDVPLPTVRSRLQHAKKRLREVMIAMENEPMPPEPPFNHDPLFTRRVVEDALRRADEAHRANEKGDALRHCDEALDALDAMETGEDRKRLKMDALWLKGGLIPSEREETLRLYEESRALAEELGDRKALAQKLVWIANHEDKHPDKAERYLLGALEIFRDIGDAGGEAEGWLWMGQKHLAANRVAEGRTCYERALPLFESVGGLDYAGVCRAMLDLLDEVGEAEFPHLRGWAAMCDGLDERSGIIAFGNQPGSAKTVTDDETPPAVLLSSVFQQLSALRTILDPTVPTGGRWAGDSFSYSYRPLRSAMTVKSDTVRVEVPAGTYERCLLLELATSESGLPDDGPERQRRLNREILCGVRRAWFAPGVGLVRLDVRLEGGKEASIWLHAYEVRAGANRYLPLAEDNFWRYGWAALPEPWEAKEAYRVIARSGDRWHLSHAGYYRKAGGLPAHNRWDGTLKSEPTINPNARNDEGRISKAIGFE